jgi:hypothetical protein
MTLLSPHLRQRTNIRADSYCMQGDIWRQNIEDTLCIETVHSSQHVIPVLAPISCTLAKQKGNPPAFPRPLPQISSCTSITPLCGAGLQFHEFQKRSEPCAPSRSTTTSTRAGVWVTCWQWIPTPTPTYITAL